MVEKLLQMPAGHGLDEAAARYARRDATPVPAPTDEVGADVADELDEQAIAAARDVLLTEAAGLSALAETVGTSLATAVRLIAGIEGRVVVSGMGKSGHVGRKIAATLASTGTPAMFVHPGEASHGDLGMVTRGDAVLALSNSGETAELRDLTLYTRRFGIPLIAMVGRAPSALAEAADCALILPEVAEACPMGLAPTTSTTCMLALGDALAVALLRRKGFTPQDFAVFHPGGKLGSQLMRVEELMHKGADLPLVPLGTRLADALIEMTGKRLGCLGVTGKDGRLEGIVTDGDLRRHMGDGLLSRPVEAVMTHSPRTISKRALAVEALKKMNDDGPQRITVLFVVERGRPVGALHLHDILRAGIV